METIDALSLQSPLLSRFDLVLVLSDLRDDEWDGDVAEFVVAQSRGQRKRHAQDSAEGESNALWPFDKLKSYIYYCKNNLAPEMTPEASEAIGRYYEIQRQMQDRPKSRTTLRLLESLKRLSQAHAKLMFRTQVLLDDVIVVIILMELSTNSPALLARARDYVSARRFSFPVDPQLDFDEKSKFSYDDGPHFNDLHCREDHHGQAPPARIKPMEHFGRKKTIRMSTARNELESR